MNTPTPTPTPASTSTRQLSAADRPWLLLDAALRTVFAPPTPQRPTPKPVTSSALGPATGADGASPVQDPLSAAEKTHAAGLMRINHVGEVCAQALYTAQAHATSSEALRGHFMRAAAEEHDHLAWTAERLEELGARPSVFNPLWYGGAFALGYVAGKLGDRVSLGFLQETELQVEAHLQSHLVVPAPFDEGSPRAAPKDDALLTGAAGLPATDLASRAIVERMRDEEAAHAADAVRLGAMELPTLAKDSMRAMANFMKAVAYRI